MRGNKRLIQGMTVAGAAGVLACSVAFSQPQIMRTEGTIQITENQTAAIMAVLNQDDQQGDVFHKLSIEKHETEQVTSVAPVPVPNVFAGERAEDMNDRAAVIPEETVTEEKAAEEKSAEEKSTKEKTDAADTQEKTEEKNTKKEKIKTEETKKEAEKKAKKEAETVSAKEKKQASAAKKWKNKLMADVDDYLNIRKASSENSAIVGKLRKGDVAKVVKKGKAWTKIKSGSVTGYVKNEYCVYGSKAYKLANKICKIYATVQADGLRIRKNANENATVLEAAFQGDKLLVSTKAKKKDGWVTVKFNNLKGYVAEEFVKVGLGTGEAISIEEERAILEAKKRAEQMAAASRASSAGSSSSSAESTPASGSSTVSSSDLTLLSAIIFCEAGGESYSGQVAVGAVVMNRVRSGSFPNSISGVVYQSGQFTPVANGALARALSNGNYQHCTSAAQAALAGSDNTGGAKFFHRVNGAAGLVIGNHVFY